MKIKAYVETNRINSRVEDVLEIPDKNIDGMPKEEKTEYIDNYVRDWRDNFMSWGWREE